MIQDDFEDGTEVRIISGKTLPEDRQFKYEQAQADVEKGLLSPTDYFETAGYDSPAEKAKNRVIYDLNKPFAVGISTEELSTIAPESPEEPPKLSIKYEDLPPDGKVQMAALAGINLNPEIVIAEEMSNREEKRMEIKARTVKTSRTGDRKPKEVEVETTIEEDNE